MPASSDKRDVEWQSLLHGSSRLDLDVMKRVDELGGSQIEKVNPVFKRSMELAVRTAFFCALAVVIEEYMPSSAPANFKAYWPSIITAVVYTVFGNVATTMMYCWQGLLGTTIALAHTWVLCHVVPDGFVLVGVIDFAVVVAIILLLNLNINVKIFALSWQAYFSMCFCSPTRLSDFMEFTWESEMTAIFAMQIIGNILALLTVLLPWPITALGQSVNFGVKTARCTAELIEFLTGYYCGEQATLDIAIFNSMNDRFRGDIALMTTATDMAWWEGFDWGTRGKIRIYMARNVKLLADLCRRLNILQACAIKEEFSEMHKEIMREVRGPCLNLVTAVGDLLMAATCDAADGTLDEEEKERKRTRIKDVTARMEELSTKFQSERNRLTQGMAGLDAELRQEGFFLRELCILSRCVLDFVEDLVDGPEPPKPWIFFDEFKKRFDPELLTSSVHLNFVWRNWLSCMIAFAAGLWHYNYDSSMPGYVTLMLSAKPGAALMGNLSRIQGTVLGMLVGNVLYIAMHDCEEWMFRCIAVFFFEILANFIYYYSNQFGSLGGLLAVFGGKLLLRTCHSHLSQEKLTTTKVGAYHQFHMVAEALLIVLIVDLIFQRQPASSMAVEKLNEAIEVSFKELRDFIDQEGANQVTEEMRTATTQQVDALVARSKYFGEEASMEPRLWKAPFRQVLHERLCDDILKVHMDMSLMIRAFLSKGQQPGLYRLLSTQPCFTALKEDLMSTMARAQKFVKDVMEYEECGLMSRDTLEDIRGLTGVRELEGLEKLAKEVVDDLGEIPSSKTLEDDKICRLSVIFTMLLRITKDIGGMIVMSVEKM